MQRAEGLRTEMRVAKSHYQFKIWLYDDAGSRRGAVVVRPIRRDCADLVNTCYRNPATGTATLYSIVWDLDAHRADERWKTRCGKLNWKKIKKFLFSEYPEFAQYILAAIRSTSGKGIALAIAISPMELVTETQRAQNAARVLQNKILVLLNQVGLGADPGALGLERDFPNWHDAARLLYINKMVMPAVQASYERTPVVTNLLEYLKRFSFLSYQRKSERNDLLYPDIRAEEKLAKLYAHALNDWHTNGNCASGYLSTQEIRSLTGLSKPFLLKFLRTAPSWLDAEWLGKNEGWNLTVNLDPKLTHRAFELISGLRAYPTEAGAFNGPLKHPSDVEDGERNEWLTQALLMLKHNGSAEQTAHELIRAHIKSIPGWETSRNCQQVEQIIRSIYGNKRHLFGIKLGCAPSWLLNPIQPIAVVVPLTINTAIEKTTSLQKGLLAPGLFKRSVSLDGCLSFRGNYYSVPREYSGSSVAVFEWGGRLRIHDPDVSRLIFVHEVVPGRGRYVILDGHHREVGDREHRYFDHVVERLSARGQNIGRLAHRLIVQHGVYALRRLWALQGVVKQQGPFTSGTIRVALRGPYRRQKHHASFLPPARQLPCRQRKSPMIEGFC